METIDIGAAFEVLELVGAEGFVLNPSNPPVCRLHNKQRGTYYLADEMTIDTSENTCSVNWSADVTKKMIPGVYSLDVYDDTDTDNPVMLYHKDDYAKARITSLSPGQESGE